eukprot:CAMPEP_0181303742 /NCGR_PEP_ID=MMETSP1101-20121128/8733_1 /TAXON_ID=46948 /ORGANISM="Rhodomonas abbreviata, Strain Caron Lab Isolate" /LENGTH=680 /DNA_ID=CAMNT_0023409361 /DNA_START=100 /DNA_END=2139 /DNA_ORIENTATION=+
MSSVLNDLIGPDAVVRRIVDKMTTATLLEDRKAGLEELLEKASEHPAVVAKLSFPLLLSWVPAAKEDLEMLRGILSTVQTCIAPESDAAKAAAASNASSFAADPSNVPLLLDLLQIHDWAVRLPVLKVMASLETHSSAALQAAILSSSQGPGRLMDLLTDEREIIRNEVLLVLSGLTADTRELELNKILAFEGAFDELFRIVKEEEEESVISSDCMTIINNLLAHNPSNGNYFREMGCVQSHVVPLLRRAGGLEPDKLVSDILWLNIIKLMGNLLQWADDKQKMQTVFGKHGVIEVTMAAVAGPDLLKDSKAIGLRLVGALVHLHTPNRILLSQLSLPGDKNGLGEALKMCVEEREAMDDAPHSLNQAAALLFQCYLHKNVDGQQHLAATLMPQPCMDDDLPPGDEPIGRQVMRAVMRIDQADDRAIAIRSLPSVSALTNVWGGATVLGLMLHANSVCQEIAAASPLELPSSGAPEMFLPSLLSSLTKGSAAQGGGIDGRGECFLLQLFALWVHQCPSAAHAIASEPSNVMWLGGTRDDAKQESTPPNVALQVRGTAALLLASSLQWLSDNELQENILNIIDSRIGIASFQQHIQHMLKSDPFVAASKRKEPLVLPPKPSPEDTSWGYAVFGVEYTAVAQEVSEGLQKTIFRIMGGATSPVRGAADAEALRERDLLREEV